MLDMARDLLPLVRSGTAVATVTVARVASSAPRGVGAAMAVTGDGAVLGSISGGCVEGEAVVLAHAVLATGRAQTARFGFDDATAHAAGLACGGQVDVVAQRLDLSDTRTMRALEDAAADRHAAVAVVVSGPETGRTLDVATAIDATAAAALSDRASRLLPGASRGEDLLVLQHAPRARLIILGAGEHAAALCHVGAAAGFAVTVCDPWETLLTTARFPAADQLVAALPHEYLGRLTGSETDARTAVCVLTHDERLDVAAIRRALSLPVGFVGAMGARATVARRAARLRDAGIDDVDLARLHSPLGLDLSGSAPEETALSVLAEIVASRHGGSGRPLREATGPIHRDRVTPSPAGPVPRDGALPDGSAPSCTGGTHP
ncbi:xanthine dehydrogenase accessory factor [Isoptericola sp. CG 20/1183]|uniref:Xanthine dehydrogenase accessory factor n=1 Tax=Isoptericola halotolerans TaxID=300560 RepID=A0ABX5EEP4_9MICO|nr:MULTISPECIES: XdhC/CoxI family protein [Isoptericola]PRZ07622.1 xanthine dehydrogenase accessory factor [Isoptericola halotolerans]PRZ08019.1 xanthine dehydrogenase accessory factor [Isoptericola sp. CG 20/1183]